MADRRLDAQRREVLVRLVKRHAATPPLFDAYQRLCEKLPTLLRGHGLRLTLDYLHLLTGEGAYRDAAQALLRDWAEAEDSGLSFSRLAAAAVAAARAGQPPGVAGVLLLQGLALADAEALRHSCKLVDSDHKANAIPAAAAMGARVALALRLPPPAVPQHGRCEHPGIAWRFCGAIPTAESDATWRQAQIQSVVQLSQLQWKAAAARVPHAAHRAWYTASYRRHEAFLQALPANRHTQWMTLRLRSHLFTALGERGVWETQALLHPVSGMPFIAASQIKNLVRRAMAARVQRLPTPEGRQAMQALLEDLLGDAAGQGTPGLLVVHDAWWVPEDGDGPLAGDIDNNHHTAYLQGHQARALPQDSPEPHPQLAVQGRLLFALGMHPAAGPEGGAIVTRCMRWLGQALAERGIGGRTAAAGAGRFEAPPSD